MKKFYIIISVLLLYSCFDLKMVHAEFTGLVPCKESNIFNKRLQSSIKKLEARLAKYDVSTPPRLALQEQIQKTKNRFDKYSQAGLLCGSDGFPHLIADGRWSHAGDFVFPGLLFIYITGWIGWAGRGYLNAVSNMTKPTEKEIILDIPLALKFSFSGFTWPLVAWQEYVSGKLIEDDTNVTISPR